MTVSIDWSIGKCQTLIRGRRIPPAFGPDGSRGEPVRYQRTAAAAERNTAAKDSTPNPRAEEFAMTNNNTNSRLLEEGSSTFEDIALLSPYI